jgi:feruloyl esterase
MSRAWLRCGLRRSFPPLVLLAAALLADLPHTARAANGAHADCTSLAQLSLKSAHVLSAQEVSGPAFLPPEAREPLEGLPSFCRVTGVISPAIRFEVWLPLADWNGKFEGTGNGGYAGAIVYRELADGVRRHYATANTDMGHKSTTPDPGSWALHHPELVIDQGYRAQHETALTAKTIIRAFYRTEPRRSYFVGCSSGGWQGLTEAQRYPREYDGIVAGAPAMEVIHLHAGTIWTNLAANQIAPTKFPLIASAVLEKCDANDGVKDGLLTDPRTCHFSPSELACRAGQKPETCLTPAEVTALENIYQGLHFSSGQEIYPGWPRGLEYALTLTRTPFVAALAASTFKDMVFEDPSWDYQHIDYDRAVRLADQRVGAILNNSSPDLKAFRSAGGKLILWHGWADPLISPLHTLEYYQKVAAYLTRGARGETAQIGGIADFARLFLAPGVNHCGGGPGPDQFDAVGALEGWVERGVAPESIIASHLTHGTVDRTRPLCAYPRVAVYLGRGSSDDAANFACREPST